MLDRSEIPIATEVSLRVAIGMYAVISNPLRTQGNRCPNIYSGKWQGTPAKSIVIKSVARGDVMG